MRGEKIILKKTVLTLSLLSLLLLSIPIVIRETSGQSTRGPRLDTIRNKVTRSPTAQLLEMTIGPPEGSDLWRGLTSRSDIEEMDKQGKTVTSRSALHLCRFIFNYRRPPLDDVNFRHALLHLMNKERMSSLIAPAGVVISSPVPPAQSLWYNAFVDPHAYSRSEAEAILYASGYQKIGGVWKMPDGADMPLVRVYSPVIIVLPLAFNIAKMFVEDANAIGLINVIQEPLDFATYIDRMFNYWDFDIGWVCNGLSRFPSHLYYWFHSSQNFIGGPKADGMVYSDLDELLDIMMHSLHQPSKVVAAKQVQEMVMGGSISNPLPTYVPPMDPRSEALPMVPVYSRVYYDVQHPDLRGAVNMFGKGIDNVWTYANLHWNTSDGYRPGTTEKKVVLVEEEYPERLNPLWATTVYAWDFLTYLYDGLIAVNPYTHSDEPWLATSWSYEATPEGMDVTFNLRLTDSQGQPIKWQDGKDITVNDVKFSWDFLHQYQIPRYWSAFRFYDPANTVIVDQDTIKARMETTSQWLTYDLEAAAYLLPPQVWTVDPRDGYEWTGNYEIINFDPSSIAYPTPNNTNPGPISLPTQVFGTGPFILQHSTSFIAANGYGDLAANRNYWMTTDDIMNKIEYMFWRAGDVIDNDVIDIADLALIANWYNSPVPPAPPEADVTGPGSSPPDDVVDLDDLATAGKYFGETETVPYEYGTPP
jgi:ABC-type transport system substrate-binding protein